MPKKLFSLRIWILIVSLGLAILAINPNPWAEGVEIKSIRQAPELVELGLGPNEIIRSINNEPIASLQQFTAALQKLSFAPVTINVKTDQGPVTYETIGTLGFLSTNATITRIDPEFQETGLQQGMKIHAINDLPVITDEDITNLSKQLFPKQRFAMETSRSQYATLIARPPALVVAPVQTTNINKGLDFAGGTRVLLKPIAENGVTDQQVTDLIDVLNNRLNVYGLADLKIRPANDLAGNKFVLIEIAGASREEVRDLMSKQGKFEAKIGDDVAFLGGGNDIVFVCRNDGSCSGVIPPCNAVADNQYSCTFQFAITLSEAAAERHADITRDLEVNLTESGDYLSKTIDFYLDDQQVDSLRIAADLKGQKQTKIAISGPGYGPTEQAAYEDAIQQMNKLQTILITGSLPLKLEIVKLDTISPVIGQELVKNVIMLLILAFVAVGVVIFIRYRRMKVAVPMIFISFCEIILTLGVAALIQWNIDLASIAGIIAAVGTGVDDQIVITDEALRSSNQYLNWKEKIKRAFGIVFAAYATAIAAMLPLWNAGAGLIRGFAVTTIIGITIGVFITRPAFASLIERLLSE